MAIADYLAWDLNNSLTTSKGVLPIFRRATTASQEYSESGSLRLVTAGEHRPRFAADGTLTLEKAASNLLTFPLRLNDSSWVKGSSITVIPDAVQGMDSNYLADRVSVSAFTGNANAQILRKSLTIGAGRQMTASAYLALAAGRFGGNDVLRVTGAGLVAPVSVPLGPIYNENLARYIRTNFTFNTSGSPTTATTENVAESSSTVNFEFYCESAVSINWAGAQIEQGNYPTSFIPQEEFIRSRARDFLQYPKNPVEGLTSFVFYCNLTSWSGDGIIVKSGGNFTVEIVGGKLRVTCGAVIANDPANLPASAKIAVRVSQGLQRVQVYVNGVMVVKQAIAGYTASAGVLDVGSDSIRKIRCAYFFNRDLSDGSIDVGGSVAGDLYELHQQDDLVARYADSYSEFDLPPVRLTPGQSVPVRFQGYQTASQSASSVTPGSGAVAQVITVTVDGVTNPQTDVVVINGIEYSRTTNTAVAADQASGLATLINAAPKRNPVTANWVSGSSFTITADTAGEDFHVGVRGRLSTVVTTGNQVGTHTLVVPNAIDYVVGRAYVFRSYAFVCEIAITAINTGSNTITFRTVPNSNVNLMFAGDQIIQTNWDLEIFPPNYFAGIREDFYSDIDIIGKSSQGFLLKNNGTTERRVTPYAAVTL